jgi:pimeloyl-ACP methyl ester carboxylesterase
MRRSLFSAQLIMVFWVFACQPVQSISPAGASPSPKPSSTSLSPTATPTPLAFDLLTRQFSYDSSKSLNMQTLTEPGIERLRLTQLEGATVNEVTYDAPGGEVSAYLVEPAGDGPFAGVVWVHKFPGSKVEFLQEAVDMAGTGIVSLLIEGRYPWHITPGNFAYDREQIVYQILDLRRGLDLLLDRGDIDSACLAYVGHDYGAMHGAVLAGVDKRIAAYVLMTPTASYYNWRTYFGPLTIDELREYIHLSPTLDPSTYVSHAAPAFIYFQFSSRDEYVSMERANELYASASEPKAMQMYDAPHELNDAARLGREAFLLEALSQNCPLQR